MNGAHRGDWLGPIRLMLRYSAIGGYLVLSMVLVVLQFVRMC